MKDIKTSIFLEKAEVFLQKNFRLSKFREHQFESIKALKEGSSVFLNLPTGGGKSLIYQFLAALDGGVLVLSPLVALMDDQVFHSKSLGIEASCIHSQQSLHEKSKSLQSWEAGDCDLLFVTPERFGKEEFRSAVTKRLPKYFVVDEAHCSSSWGHDFRPDYSKLEELRALLKNPPTLACTATATEQTQADIINNLGLGEVEVFKSSILRSNLSHQVSDALDFKDKSEKVLEVLKKSEGATLIYFSLIKNLEAFSEVLEKKKIKFVKYHSKLESRERRLNQKKFLENNIDLMLATPAFGLGVNKPNIRNLIHFELPGSIEAYVQEFGRAGRDGLQSYCHLFYSQEDIQVQMDFIKWGYPDPDIIRWAYRQIGNTKKTGFPFKDIYELKKKMNFFHTHDFRLESAVNILLRWGCLLNNSGLLMLGAGDLEEIPDLKIEFKEIVRLQQVKLYELIKLVRLSDVEFVDSLKKYFGENS